MRIEFGDFGFNNEQYHFTVKLGNQIVQDQMIQMPSIMMQQQFQQLTQQIAQDDRPMQIKLSKKTYTEKDKEIEESLAFENQAYVRAFGEDKNS